MVQKPATPPETNGESPARTLLLMRHAKTEQSSPDEERELMPQGEQDAKAAGKWLVAQGLEPDLVLVSTATRTQQTWAHATRGKPRLAGVEVWPEHSLYQAHPEDVLAAIRLAPEVCHTVLVVGHAPGVPGAVAQLIDPEDPAEDFPTSTIAEVAIDSAWADLAPGGGRLRQLHTSRA